MDSFCTSNQYSSERERSKTQQSVAVNGPEPASGPSPILASCGIMCSSLVLLESLPTGHSVGNICLEELDSKAPACCMLSVSSVVAVIMAMMASGRLWERRELGSTDELPLGFAASSKHSGARMPRAFLLSSEMEG